MTAVTFHLMKGIRRLNKHAFLHQLASLSQLCAVISTFSQMLLLFLVFGTNMLVVEANPDFHEYDT
jgi:hypothetical protein